MATEILPIIALRNKVLLPGSLMRLFIGRERSVKLVRSRLWDDRRGSLRKNAPLVGIFTRREHQEDDTAQTDQNDNEEASEGAVADVAGLGLDIIRRMCRCKSCFQLIMGFAALDYNFAGNWPCTDPN